MGLADSTALSGAMSQGLLKLDDVKMPGHPITGFGKGVAELLAASQSEEGAAVRGHLNTLVQGAAARRTMRQQEAKTNLWEGLFGKSQAKLEVERQERERVAAGAGVLAVAGIWAAERLLAWAATRNERQHLNRVAWDLLRFAAHDGTGRIPLHIDFQLYAMPQRLGASRAEVAKLAVAPIPYDLGSFEPMTPDYPLPLRLEMGRLVAFVVRLNSESPGALRERDLRSFLTGMLALSPYEAGSVLQRARSEHTSVVNDLSGLVGATLQCLVESAADIRARGLVLNLDEMCQVAEQVAGYDPFQAERLKRRQIALGALAAGTPVLAGVTAQHWLGPAAATAAREVAQACVDGAVGEANRALLIDLEQKSLGDWRPKAGPSISAPPRWPDPAISVKPAAPKPKSRPQPRMRTPAAEPAEETARMQSPSETRPEPHLSWQRDGVRYKQPIHDRLLIGRSANADVQIPDGAVSSRHAVLEVRGAEVWLRDVGSKNGTFVNGHSIREVELENGDLIQIGSFRLNFRAP